MGTIKYRNGMDLTEAEDIKKRWQEDAVPQPVQGPNSQEAKMPQPAQGFDLHAVVMHQPAWESAP